MARELAELEWMEETNKVELTKVVFRVFPDGDVIALFPEEAWNENDPSLCASFMHVGQHGAARYNYVINNTRPAKPEEYAALKAELEAEPYCYRLTVRQRFNRQRSKRS